nr:MAG TPA: hypothetical protein [Caudoviricetes sp.]
MKSSFQLLIKKIKGVTLTYERFNANCTNDERTQSRRGCNAND